MKILRFTLMNYPSTNGGDKLAPLPLRQELIGRLRNITKLKHWQMAVAEAVQNSMDAIIDAKCSGKISIEIDRANDLASSGDGGNPIKTIVVRDNGVGFDDGNYQSFCTPDSLKKQKRGGKGLGRLACLQAFQRIRVYSIYKNGVGWNERKLVLQSEVPELTGTETASEKTDYLTEVRLEDLKPEFEPAALVSIDSLAEWLSEHFLAALVERPAWLESLTIPEGKNSFELMRVIEGGAAWVEKFKIRGYDFKAVCYSISSDEKKDMVRLVAGGRIVNSNTQPLDFYVSHLSSISDKKPHLVLIYSPFFDEHVNDARNGVAFAEEGDGGLLQITAPEFREACANAFKDRLAQQLQTSTDKFKERISEIVTKDAPYYRPLLLGFFSSKDFLKLSTHSSDEDILSALDSYKRRDAVKLKQESRATRKAKSGR